MAFRRRYRNYRRSRSRSRFSRGYGGRSFGRSRFRRAARPQLRRRYYVMGRRY